MRTRLARGAAAAAAAAAVAAAAPTDARSALFFFFNPASATAGDRVTVRTAGTPATFKKSQRARPFGQPMRLYLVSNATAPEVQSRFDRRLQFIGTLVPDRRGRGLLTFIVPPLETDGYAAAVWCPGCARYSFGRTFSVLHVGEDTVARYRPLMLLRVTMPPANAEACPVTIPNGWRPRRTDAPLLFHGNGALWTTLPRDGVLTDAAPKLYWWSARPIAFTVEGHRLDAHDTLDVRTIRRGTAETVARGGATWASLVLFPSDGCWKVTARDGDISLSFVVKVVRV